MLDLVNLPDCWMIQHPINCSSLPHGYDPHRVGTMIQSAAAGDPTQKKVGLHADLRYTAIIIDKSRAVVRATDHWVAMIHALINYKSSYIDLVKLPIISSVGSTDICKLSV